MAMKKECCNGDESHEDDCCWTLIFKRCDEQNKQIHQLRKALILIKAYAYNDWKVTEIVDEALDATADGTNKKEPK